jgi:hypothetical protein
VCGNVAHGKHDPSHRYVLRQCIQEPGNDAEIESASAIIEGQIGYP